ncbi:MAG: zinc ABC transporter substrate-binding protein [Moritella sp.]|uniref:metal ABC transporter solute-binding protein, Zn/Mn family n=1 Tax=Moritella sp. TaxID=78556 RepID=UPI0029BD55D1|nr:zinc ABC transporter substrate-binding protein [Moritella sp.]MDX2322041.1 zinc ABC transporter substrate-binding protein [Moritella sp.]
MFKTTLTTSMIVLGLTTSSTVMAEQKLVVISSFSILGDLVSEIGQQHVSVTNLVKVNGDAHVFSPTPQDAKAISSAQLVVMNGLQFEGWMPRLLEAANYQGVQVIAANGIDELKTKQGGSKHEHHDHDHEQHSDEHEHHDHAHHDHGDIDPHAWHSIKNVKIYVNNITQGLIKVDPENRLDYQQNATDYIQELEQLAVKLGAQLATIPEAQRKVITPHDAFGYFARDFNVTFLAPQGTSTGSEASAADVARLIKQIRHDNVNAVFMENITDNRLIEQISRETDAKIGGKLYSDALSSTDQSAATYLAMMQYNVDTIVDALK